MRRPCRHCRPSRPGAHPTDAWLALLGAVVLLWVVFGPSSLPGGTP